MLIDTHSHLYWNSFKEDFDQVIQRSFDAGVEQLINIGVDLKTSQTAADMENNKIKFYSSIGIHPHEAAKYLEDTGKIDQDIKILRKIYQTNPDKVVLVGECGLDYLIDPELIPSGCSTEKIKELQQKLLQAQIDLAKELGLPLTIHVRDDRTKNPDNSECWDKIIEMTRDHFGIFHCYSGLPKTTNQILKTRFLVSFAATITYPNNEYLRNAAKILPLQKIILETDCPFLPPQSKRGTRNEPQTVKEIAELIARLKDTDFEEIAGQTTQNVKRLIKHN